MQLLPHLRVVVNLLCFHMFAVDGKVFYPSDLARADFVDDGTRN